MSAAFITLLNSATGVRYQDGLLRVFTGDPAEPKTEQVFSMAEMDALHPEFRSTIALVAEYYQRVGIRFELTTSNLQHIWAQCTHPRRLGTTSGKEHYIGHVRAVIYDEPNQRMLLEFYSYTVLTELPANLILPAKRVSAFPINHGLQFVPAPLSWMDANYPGWKERYEAALALGCGAQAIADFVCNNADAAPPSPIPLTGVTFD